MKKRIISILLVAVMLVSLMVMPASADNNSTDSNMTQYQTVFIHGLLGFGYNDAVSNLLCYWGMTSGNMITLLNSEGYDVINASVGPCSSCWDRCCELFAQLTGTKTDYGAYHAAKVSSDYANESNGLKHDRYGRDYTGAATADNWGPIYDSNGKVTGWYDNKLNLIGHSFGGPTATMFLQLLAYGDENEIAWGKQQAALYGGDWHDYVSPLFWGDYNGQYLINSITSLAGVLNGTTFLSTCKDEGELIMTLLTGVADTLGKTDFNYIYDFQLEHFGITTTPGVDPSAEDIKNFLNTDAVSAFLDGYDNALYDLSIQGCNDLKQGWETFDNVYYFSYAGDLTNKDPLTGNYLPDPSMLVLFWSFATKIGSYDYSFEQVKDIYGNNVSNITKEWLPNDGMVNTISARYPIGAAHKEYDANNIEKGTWQWQDMRYDHMTFCGGLLDPNVVTQPIETRRFYHELMSNIAACTPDTSVKPGNGSNELPFTDVSADDWFYDAVKYVYENGLMSGVSADKFSPNTDVTRAMVVKVLWNMELAKGAVKSTDTYAKTSFTDIDENSWYAQALAWAAENKIAAGTSASTFEPNAAVTREQLATFLMRYAEYNGIDTSELAALNGFADASSVSAWAVESVQWAVKVGIISGVNVNGTMYIKPVDNASRAQLASILMRYNSNVA